ncbi:RNA-directed DNA polymerase, eukaryota, reverse transcriptase zinc-binding domain protein [Tanacetum coccineum]
MVWASWSSLLASKNNGGPGVSSFYALNRALMFKWVWRFRTQGSSLWDRVIAAIHGDLGHLHRLPTSSYSSTWMDIVRVTFNLKQQGIDLISYILKKVGNGENSLFWDDIWMGDTALKEQYPRVYALEASKSISIADKLAHSNVEVSLRRPPRVGVELYQSKDLSSRLVSIQLPMIQGRWIWSLDGTGKFSTESVRKLLDDKRLPKVSSKTRWIKPIPIKVNVFAWKVGLNKLPTRLNLSMRGLEIGSISCPICDAHVESTSHLFFSCSTVKDVLCKISLWWDIVIPEVDSYDQWLNWFLSLHIRSNSKTILKGIFYITWWHVWNFGNKTLFDSTPPIKAVIYDDIVSRSFTWCNSRFKYKCSWVDWLKNPKLVIM